MVFSFTFLYHRYTELHFHTCSPILRFITSHNKLRSLIDDVKLKHYKMASETIIY